MKASVPQPDHGRDEPGRAFPCSGSVPDAGRKKSGCREPAIPCPVSKIRCCSGCSGKNQHPPASARHSPVAALCGLFPGGAGTYPVRAAEAMSERVAGTEERPVPVILNAVKNPFSLLRVNRDGTGDTDPSTSLCSAQDDSDEQSARNRSTRCAPLQAEKPISQRLCNLPFGRRYRTHWTWDAEAG